MKRFYAWLVYLAKQTLKRKAFLLLFAALLLTGLAAALSSQTRQVIRIALFCEQPDDMTEAALLRLTEQEDGLYQFYRCDSLDFLKEDVAACKAECGYVFPSQLEAAMQAGEEGVVTVYTSAATSLSSVVNESVYNAIFHEYAQTMLTDYLEEQLSQGETEADPAAQTQDASALTRSDLKEAVALSFAWEEEHTSLFHVEYEELSDAFYDEQSVFQIPLPGFAALLIFLGALSGVSQYRSDLQQGRPLLRDPKEKRYVPFLYSLLPALFLAVCGFAALLAAQKTAGAAAFGDFLLLVLYAFFCAVSGRIIGRAIRSALAFDALLPLAVLFCLLYAPVLTDLSSYLPGGAILRWCAPPTWYLSLRAFFF